MVDCPHDSQSVVEWQSCFSSLTLGVESLGGCSGHSKNMVSCSCHMQPHRAFSVSFHRLLASTQLTNKKKYAAPSMALRRMFSFQVARSIMAIHNQPIIPVMPVMEIRSSSVFHQNLYINSTGNRANGYCIIY